MYGKSLSFFKVIPVMALIVGYLGDKLRQTSNKAHLTTASLSAYLNEVFRCITRIQYILHCPT